MSDNLNEDVAGTAMAAFTLAQISFWALHNSGLISKDDAEKMLKSGIDANAKGGPANQRAAAMLNAVLKEVSVAKLATRQ